MAYTEPYSGEFKYIYQLGMKAPTTHPLFTTWWMMNIRCYDTRHKAYHRYGGRGIFVQPVWRWDSPNAFVKFVSDVGERPKGLTLDRPFNNLGYGPDNWRWATKREQQNNIGIGTKNESGEMGVSWNSEKSCWVAQIALMGYTQVVGRFNEEDFDKAVERYELVKSIKIKGDDEQALAFANSFKELTPTEKNKRRNKTSEYYGVSWQKNACKWRACVHERVDGKLVQIHLGLFLDEKDAYNAVLKRLELTKEK